tara:strand:+ start:237 stop:446 length:210 start_codon:yes stop_codon:yes gene_type:complete
MADTTITITIPEAQWSTVQAAYASTDSDVTSSDITAAVVKGKLISELKSVVGQYDKQRQTIAQSSFSPS